MNILQPFFTANDIKGVRYTAFNKMSCLSIELDLNVYFYKQEMVNFTERSIKVLFSKNTDPGFVKEYLFSEIQSLFNSN